MSRETPSDPPAPSRRERRKLEVRTRIYLAAHALFDAQGFDETTVDEIAEAADVAPATFFNHFQNKQALLGLMAEGVVDALGDLAAQHFERGASSARRLRDFTRAAVDEIRPRRRVARLVLLEFIREASPDGPTAYLRRVHEPIVALIEEGQQRGEFRDDYDSVFLAQMAVGMLNSAITRWLTDGDYPVEQGLVEATEFVLNTLKPATPNPST